MNNLIVVDSEKAIPNLENAKKVFDVLDVQESSRSDYKARIHLFIEFLHNNPINLDSFLQFKRWLDARPDYAVSTKNKYLITAKIFLKELARRGVLPSDITQNIKTFKQIKKHKRDGINDAEMDRLIQALRELPILPENTRLKAILSLLTFQGLRLAEVTRLDVSDLDFVNKTALIQSKGADDKELIALHPEAVATLREYLKASNIADGPLFICRSNNRRNARLTTQSIGRVVKDLLRYLNVEKTPHGFRHYFVTRLIKNYKSDLLAVAQYSRHRSLEMFVVYNDNVNLQADLPRFYRAFEGLSFQ